MNPKRLRLWAAELAQLAVDDAEVLSRATLERQTREDALRLAQQHEELAARKAEASSGALESAQRWMSPRSGDRDTTGDSREGAQPSSDGAKTSTSKVSVAAVIKGYLRVKAEATYAEIKGEVARVRPDVKAQNCARDLNRMVKRGVLTRPRTGSYKLVVKESDPMTP
ncbi:hypothetical protein ACWD4V_18160 [Streptomyces tsukubensis]